MKYKVIIFDIDGTIALHISSWQYIHEKLGLWDDNAYKYQEAFRSGKISYRKFCKLDTSCWKGLPERKIVSMFKNAPYAKNALRYIPRLKKLGFKLVAISTGLQYLAERIRSELKFDYVVSNELVSKKGIITGNVKIKVKHNGKGKIVKDILKKFRVRSGQVISIGDGSGDIPLVKNSGYSIAFNSSDKTFLNMVDYACRTSDFKEVFDKIIYITNLAQTGNSGCRVQSYAEKSQP